MKRLYFLSLLIIVASIFNLSAKPEQSITVVITTYNNNEYFEDEPQCIRSIASVLNQCCCKNYKVIIVDDHSSDGTFDIVKRYVKKQNQSSRVTFVRNEHQYGEVYSHYRGVYLCDDNEIIMPLRGTEILAHEHVLKHINQAYSDSKVWLTYGHSLIVPNYTVSNPEELALYEGKQKKTTRSMDWDISYPAQTFYAWLYKSIKLQDLIYKGRFIGVMGKQTELVPMLEMAGDCCKYIPEILSVQTKVANDSSQQRVNLLKKSEVTKYLQEIQPYEKLSKPLKNRVKASNKSKVDVLLLSVGNSHQLRETVVSLNKVKNINTIYVVYDRNYNERTLQKVLKRHTSRNIKFIKLSKNNTQNKSMVLDVVQRANNHIICVSSDAVFTKSFDVKSSIALLEKTCAHAYYFDRGLDAVFEDNHNMYLPVEDVSISETAYIWQFMMQKNTWKYNSPFVAALYRKADVINFIKHSSFKTVKELLDKVSHVSISQNKLGLLSKQTKVMITVKKNIKTEESECDCSECQEVNA